MLLCLIVFENIELFLKSNQRSKVGMLKCLVEVCFMPKNWLAILIPKYVIELAITNSYQSYMANVL